MKHRVVVFALALLALDAGCTSGRGRDDTGPGSHLDGGSGNDAYFAPVDTDIVTSTAPANAATLFGGTASAAHAPELVYPLDGVAVPPNLSQLEFHYLPAG